MRAKKWTALLLTLALVLAALSGCASQTADEPAATEAPVEPAAATETPVESEAPAAADGTYSGKANGYGGELTLNVTVADGAISAIEVGENGESTGIGGRALQLLPERVVEAQTLAVDNISGATITTAAFKAAVKDALSQAGAQDGAFEAALPEQAHTEESLSYDVVVVGSGVAGQAAALAAAQNGASVLMLEKCSIIGGTTNASGGAVMGTMSPLNEERGDESKELADWWYERDEEHANYDQLLFVTKQSGENIKWLMELGWNPVLGTGGGSTKEWSHRPDDGTGNRLAHGGFTVIDTMHDAFEALGGVTMVDTPATELLTDADGNVTGVMAEGKHTTYTIEAKGGVVLACGGFENDADMMQEYAPNSVGTVSMGANVGDTGDAIRMAKAVGAQIVAPGYTMPTWNFIEGVASYADGESKYHVDASALRADGRGIEVDQAMERFVNETVSTEFEKGAMARVDGHTFYVLLDSNHDEETKAALEQAAADGVIARGDTLAELAANIGGDAAALEATVARWNEMAEKGVDEDFSNEKIQPFAAEGPYYACYIHEGSTGSYGGPQINLNSEVLRPDGTAISGLYAAGECANGEFYYRDYICGGSSLAMGLAFGRTAGTNAAARAK